MSYDSLAIKKYKKQILYGVEMNDVTIITAEAGSGKTTQIPQFLIQAGYTLGTNKIVIALPRKIAAISLAKRVGEELGCHQGEITHHVRFQNKVNQHSKVVFMTDGMLLQQLYSNPLLEGYSVIILDDVHEQSINFEILFAMLKRILQLKNNKIKLIITSATIYSSNIINYYKTNLNYKNNNNKIISICKINIIGKKYQIKINYLRQDTNNYFLKIFQTIIYIDREKKQNGNLLVFLTSVQEIQAMMYMLESYTEQNHRNLKILPLHSMLSLEQQQKIFDYSNNYDKKIILSTNIAQSSITIPDIVYVIDCGYVKIKVYDHQLAVQKMMIVPCGRNSCYQRACRAGRVQDGQCYRIFTEKGYSRMVESIPAEIMRVDLCNFILKLKGLGIQDIYSFEMLQKPPENNLIKAIDTLFAYGVIDEYFELTTKGKIICELSLDIRNACMLINSFEDKFGCSRQILMLVSMLQIQRQLFFTSGISLLKSKKKIGAKEGDFLTLINIFIRYSGSKLNDRKRICSEYKLKYQTMQQVLKIHEQLIQMIKKINRYKSKYQEMQIKYGVKEKQYNLQIKSSSSEYESILRCILTGYFTNIAQIQSDGTYCNIRSKEILHLNSTSILSVIYPEWIIYYEIIKTITGYQIYNGSQIQPDWIFQLVGHYYEDRRKQQIQDIYNKNKNINQNKINQQPQHQEKKLIQIGGFKANKVQQHTFNTNILGLKKKMKKTQLSFQEEI